MVYRDIQTVKRVIYSDNVKFKVKNPDENQLIDDPEKLKELISKAKNPEPGTYSIGDSDAIVANTISIQLKDVGVFRGYCY